MSPATSPVDALRSWLGSPEGLDAMTGAARQVLRRLHFLRLHTAMDQLGIGPGTPTETAVDEVRGDLYRFVLEIADRLSASLAAVKPNAGRYLCQAFINHCRDLEQG